MKKIILLVACAFSVMLSAQNTSVNWSNDYLVALETSKSQNKPLVLVFENPNASEKIIESLILESKEFESLTSELIVLRVHPIGLDGITDTQKTYSKRLIGHYNPTEQFPGIVVIAPNKLDTASLFGEINSSSTKTFIEKLKSLL